MSDHFDASAVGGRLPGSHTGLFDERELAELVVLQRCCWVQEAILNDTLEIPALHESHQDVLDWTREWTTLTTRLNGRLVAAVRGRSERSKWHVGRLMVAPDLAGHGIGSALLHAIESAAPPSTTEYILFTGGRSQRNILLYERAGYQILEASDADFINHIKGAVYLSKTRTRHQNS